MKKYWVTLTNGAKVAQLAPCPVAAVKAVVGPDAKVVYNKASLRHGWIEWYVKPAPTTPAMLVLTHIG